MPPLSWILSATMQERMRNRGCGGATLADAARAQGDAVFLIEGHTDEWDWTPLEALDDTARVVVHGTFHFARALNRWRTPLWFSQTVDSDPFAFSMQHQAEFLGPWLLNQAPQKTTWGVAKTRDPRAHPFFIRPDSAWKPFGGTVAAPNAMMAWEKLLERTDIPDDAAVATAPLQDILGEARHLIVGGRLSTSSTYRWNNRLDIRIDTHPLQDDLARLVAGLPNQPDDIYICDTALIDTPDGLRARVVELNGFTSAGFYGLDARAIARDIKTHLG